LGWNPTKRLHNRSHVDFYWVDEGPPTEQEVTEHHERTRKNRNVCVEAMRRRNLELSADYHKARTAKSGAIRKGKHWVKDVALRVGRSVVINGITFNNLKHASKVTGLNAYFIRKRAKSADWPNYVFI
jgi:hypothetical protein